MNWWLQFAGPGLLTLSVLTCLGLLYRWQRKASFVRRERRRKEDPAEKLDIPILVKKPEQYDGGKTFHEAQWKYSMRASEAQGSYFAGGLLSAILPAVALFLLSFQLLAFATGESWMDIGLILAEMLCLIVLVYLAITGREPTADWIEHRVRTELFRREQYLFLAGVGPYFLAEPSTAIQEAIRRRSEIEGGAAHLLIELVPMQERSGITWMEALHRAGSGKLSITSDLIARMESYLYYRIGKQLSWFANEIRDLRENDRFWSRMLAGTLLAAIMMSALHTVHLYDAHIRRDALARMAYLKLVTGVLAIALPPLGSACLSLKAMYNFRGRGRIYQYEKSLLHRQWGALDALIQEAKHVLPKATTRDLQKIDFSFRAITLRTEQSLSIELTQWTLLMERPEHEVAP